MSLPAQNYSILAPDFVLHGAKLNPSLESESKAFLNDIRDAIVSQIPYSDQLHSILPRIFEFRIRALRELYRTPDFDLMSALDEVQELLDKVKQDPDLGIVAENILFALRWNRRIANAFMQSEATMKEDIIDGELPEMTYRQFVSAIAMSFKEHVAQRVIDWMDASLSIEFGAMCLLVISEEELQLPDEKLSQLAALTSKAGQNYASLALEMGVFRANRSEKSYVLPEFDESYINQQQALADEGLEDYAANLDDDEAEV